MFACKTKTLLHIFGHTKQYFHKFVIGFDVIHQFHHRSRHIYSYKIESAKKSIQLLKLPEFPILVFLILINSEN